MQKTTAARAPLAPWTSQDRRYPDAPACPHVGPLPDAVAELVASLEFTRGVFETTDWSSMDQVSHCARGWQRRLPEMQAGHGFRVAFWHGEEAYHLRRAIHRTGRQGRITTASARQAVAWRMAYLRRQLLAMAAEYQLPIDRDFADGARLTYGRNGFGTTHWYAFDDLA